MIAANKPRTEKNAADKIKEKKFGIGASMENINAKRGAFNDLKNRVQVKAISEKDAAAATIAAGKNTLKDANIQNALRNAKARIDAQAKKPTVLVNSAVTNALPAVRPRVAVAQAPAATATSLLVGAQRKIVTRKAQRVVATTATGTVAATGTGTGVAVGLGLQRRGSKDAAVVPTKPKTVTAKVVENKVQQAKLINHKPKVSAGEDKKLAAVQPTMRREDSNISRKSLTKLKAAIAREVLKPVAKVNAVPTAVVAKNVEQSQPKKGLVVEQAPIECIATTEINEKTKRAEYRIEDILTHSSKLLYPIDNIDANDADNLMLVSDYVNEIYEYLFSLECELAVRKNHLEGQEEVYPKMRAVLIDWVNEVHFQFHLNVETFQMAVAIIDLYLQAVKDTKRSQLQLVGITALFIAAKYEELYPPPIDDFVYITDNTYTGRQLVQMELQIFKALECNLSRPLPIHFLRRFSKAANAEDNHHTMAKYFLELVTIEYDLASYKPSEVAAASLYLALHLLADKTETSVYDTTHWTPTLEHYSQYSAEKLQSLAQKIAKLARNAPNDKLKAVYSKYQSSRFDKIAMHPQLEGKLIDSIIASATKQESK